MAAAALIVSIVAAVVTIAGAFFTWQQAEASVTSVRILKRQDRAARQPEFDATVESVNDGGWYRLTLRMTKGEFLEEASVTVVEGEGLLFSGSQDGVPGRFRRLSASTVTPVVAEAATRWRVSLEDEFTTRPGTYTTCCPPLISTANSNEAAADVRSTAQHTLVPVSLTRATSLSAASWVLATFTDHNVSPWESTATA